MAEPARNRSSELPASNDFSLKSVTILAGLTVLAVLVMGYHPGLEDDAFYLAAIKMDLKPVLFPHDADFLRLQFQATIFDKVVAFSVKLLHLPLAWMVLFWQMAAVFLLLLGCWRISRRCFLRPEAQWSAVTLVAALLGMPLPGIAILLADQYLHPRTLATAAILAAIVAVIDRKAWLAAIFLAIAFAIHAIMACFGISFCAFLAWRLHARRIQPDALPAVLLVSMPLGWIFQLASDSWRQAAATRGFYFLGRWHWYEWLGVFAPLVILFALCQFLQTRAETDPESVLVPLISSLLYYGVFQTTVGIALMLPASLERLRPFEPMRYLHLLYLVFFLIVGGLLGAYVLDRHRYRWALLFVPLCAGMFYAQRQMYPASPHLELPFNSAGSGWLRAFDWIRLYTPLDSEFALDPHYETLPGEDYHGFRALAERSTLADYEKDAGMAARVPSLAPRWLTEVTALKGWREFQAADFDRLKRRFGVNWVVLSRVDSEFANPDPAVMVCRYANEDVKVCRLR